MPHFKQKTGLSSFSLIGIILIFFITFSCKKKNLAYQLEGTIYDSSFNTTMSGATVSLLVVPTGTSTAKVLETQTTGSDGKYSFSFKREKYESIQILVTKSMYFDGELSTTLDNLDIENVNTNNFNIYAKSWVRIHITGNGTNDCKYIRQEGLSGCDECCPTTTQEFTTPTDTSVYCINNGNTIYQVYYNVLNTSTQGPIGVTTVPFDTTELLISY